MSLNITRFFLFPVLLACGAGTSCTTDGGATGEFSRDQDVCEATSEVALTDSSELGFSPASILEFSEGDYTTPIQWFSPCGNPDNPCGRGDCSMTRTPLAAGTETTLLVSVESTGQKALVYHGSGCAQSMNIPVNVLLSTDDGLLEEQFEATLWTETGEDSLTYEDGLVRDLNGDLSNDDVLRSDTRYSFDLFFNTDEVELDMYVADPEGRPILVYLLPPYDSCAAVIKTTD